MRNLRILSALAAVAALAVPAGALAAPDPTRASLASQATYVSPGLINLEVRLSCSAGLGYSVFANALQQEGSFVRTWGDGSTSGMCTGQTQKIAVSVFAFSFPGWQLGDALAQVHVCSFTCVSAAREVRISL